MSNFFERGGAWFLVQLTLLAAFLAAAWFGRGTLPELGFLHVWRGILGGLVLGFALGQGGTAVVQMGTDLTPLPKPKSDSDLITCGVYRWVRHPMYGALLLGMLGFVFIFWSASAVGVFLAGCVFFSMKARREEEFLLQQFPEYASYRQKTKRFVPLLV